MITVFKRIWSDELFRHTAVVFAGMSVVYVCNLLFQMAVSRRLPAAEFTLLAAFLGVLAIIGLPLSTLSIGISHHASLLVREGRSGDVKRLLGKWLLIAGVPAVVVGAAVIVWNEPLAGLLHLDRVHPVIIAGAALPALFWLAVLVGAGQGLQLFGWVSASTIGGSLVRLALGAGLVWLVHPSCGWAMLGHGLGIYVAAAVLLPGVLLMLRRARRTAARLPSMRYYLLQSVFIQTAYAVLMNADIVLVKHFLPEETEFAYAATLGRLVAFLPGAIVMAMFPKVASRGAGSQEQHQVFRKALLWTGLMVFGSALGCFLFAGLLARILYGIEEASGYLKGMIGVMSVVMGFSALLNVALQYLLAQRRFLAGLVPVVCAVAYVAATAWLHASAWQIIAIAGTCNALACTACLVSACRRPACP